MIMAAPVLPDKDSKPRQESRAVIEPGLLGSQRSDRKILVATSDLEVRNDLGELLKSYGCDSIWARTLGEAKSNLSRRDIAVCLSGFWLVDGTYRDIVRYMTMHVTEIPLVILCPRNCSREQYEFLANLNTGAFRFVPHPYQAQDLYSFLSPDEADSNVRKLVTAPSEPPLRHSGPLGFPAFRRAT
jgi:DNA-binding NtrC family response regulator